MAGAHGSSTPAALECAISEQHAESLVPGFAQRLLGGVEKHYTLISGDGRLVGHEAPRSHAVRVEPRALGRQPVARQWCPQRAHARRNRVYSGCSFDRAMIHFGVESPVSLSRVIRALAAAIWTLRSSGLTDAGRRDAVTASTAETEALRRKIECAMAFVELLPAPRGHDVLFSLGAPPQSTAHGA